MSTQIQTFRLGGAGGLAVVAEGRSMTTLLTVSIKSDDGFVATTIPLVDPNTLKRCREVIAAADVTTSDGRYLLNLCKQAWAGRALS